MSVVIPVVQSEALTLLRILFHINNNNISWARCFPVESSTINYLYMNPLVNTLHHVMAIVEDSLYNRTQAQHLRLIEGKDVFFGNNTDPIDQRDIIHSWGDFDRKRLMKRRLPLDVIAVCRMRMLVKRRKALHLALYALRNITEMCVRHRICAWSNLCDIK